MFEIEVIAAIVARACSWMLCFYRTSEALTSKKKSKVRKEPKPAKSQGRTFIHHRCNSDMFCLIFCISYFHSRPIVPSMLLNNYSCTL